MYFTSVKGTMSPYLEDYPPRPFEAFEIEAHFHCGLLRRCRRHYLISTPDFEPAAFASDRVRVRSPVDSVQREGRRLRVELRRSQTNG